MTLTGRAVFVTVVAMSVTGVAADTVGRAGTEVIVRGVTVYGMDREDLFPVIVRDTSIRDGNHGYITIQFDVHAAGVPLLKIRFLHCNRDWIPDKNLFVQDEHYSSSFFLDYRTAPDGVKGYTHRYINRFPDADGIVRFTYSGNWIFRIMDRDETAVFAEGRFLVVDNFLPTTITVANGYWTENDSPLNQIHKVSVNVTLGDEVDGYYQTTVDVYQNRRLYNPYRIDAYDRNPYTSVEGFASGSRQFSASNILPGNEYRVLDLGNATRYPNRETVRPVDGVDHHRRFVHAAPDRNGVPVLNRFTGIHSDYLDVMFRLRLTDSDMMMATRGGRGIFLAGPFNDWSPRSEDQLAYSRQEDALVVHRVLRRGIYDYQYITGQWDRERQAVTGQDWVGIEGNDWRTSNLYSAFVYYNDPRFGGFDRIVGYAAGQNTPGFPGSH